MTLLIWASIVVSLAPSLYAQDRIYFDRIYDEGTLSYRAVTTLMQDYQGFLWVGTQSGLNRYAGTTVRQFHNLRADSTSLIDNYINALHEDRHQRIWIGTRGGLSRFDPRTETFTNFPAAPDVRGALSHPDVTEIIESPDGTLWFGTNGGGLHRWDPTTEMFTVMRADSTRTLSLSSDQIYALHFTAPNTLWIGTERGLDRWIIDTDDITPYRFPLADQTPASVRALHTDTSGTLWIGTWGQGLQQLDLATNRLTPYRHDPANPHSLADNAIYTIKADQQNRLWIGTSGSGLDRFDPTTGRFIHHRHNPNAAQSLSDDTIYDLLEDRSGNLWVATISGLDRYAPSKYKFPRYLVRPDEPAYLSHQNIKALHQTTPDHVWVGSWGGGLSLMNLATEQATHYRHTPNARNTLSHDDVFAITSHPSGVLWIGTLGGGLNRLDPKTGRFTHYTSQGRLGYRLSDDRVHDVLYDPDGYVWLTTRDGGLNKLDIASGRITHYLHDSTDTSSVSHNWTWPLYQDTNGILWVGTLGGGLNAFDPQTERFQHYLPDPANPYSLSHAMVVALHEAPRGTLWIGTFGGGLNRLDTSTGLFTTYTVEDGLPHNNIHGILSTDKGDLWLSTENGLSKFDPTEDVFTNYDGTDGLQDESFLIGSYHEGLDGTFFYGGTAGLNAFQPDLIADNTVLPRVVLTDFQLFYQTQSLTPSITYTQHLSLDHDENYVLFAFAGLEFTEPQKNGYRYRLRGSEYEEWIEVGNQQTADFPGLVPGRYTFEVQAANNDGLWNPEGASLTFNIAKPYWATWWFRILMALAGGSLLAVFYLYRVNQLLRLERDRRRIADDLHDDIGSKMSSIALAIDMNARQLKLSGERLSRLKEVAQTARTLVDDLRDTVWLVDAQYDTLRDLVSRMQTATRTLLPPNGYAFHLAEPLPELSLEMDQRRNLFLFYKEVLHNIARHAHADHTEITVSWKDGHVVLDIQDNGIGFDGDTVTPGRGLVTLMKRAQHFGTEPVIESARGCGTRVRLHARIV